MVINATFITEISFIAAGSFNGGGNRSTRRALPTCLKSLTNYQVYLTTVVLTDTDYIASDHDHVCPLMKC